METRRTPDRGNPNVETRRTPDRGNPNVETRRTPDRGNPSGASCGCDSRSTQPPGRPLQSLAATPGHTAPKSTPSRHRPLTPARGRGAKSLRICAPKKPGQGRQQLQMRLPSRIVSRDFRCSCRDHSEHGKSAQAPEYDGRFSHDSKCPTRTNHWTSCQNYSRLDSLAADAILHAWPG